MTGPGASGFTWKAPGLVGVDQTNVQIPAGVREGCAVPVRSGAQNFETQPVLVSIHTGGGQCVDPPLGSLGNIAVSKTAVMNATSPSEIDTFTAQFDASPGKQPPPPPPPLVPAGAYAEEPNTAPTTPPSCPIPGYTSLDAGTFTLSGGGLPATQVMPSSADGYITYSASLPAGSVRPGQFQISANGGKGVTAFQTGLALGADIHVTSQFPPGTYINVEQPFVVNWTGGDVNSIVTVRLISHQFLYDDILVAQSVALDGSVNMQPFAVNPTGPAVLPIRTGSNVEVIVDVGPNQTKPITFSAPGLTLGGLATWKYTYDFPGLTIAPPSATPGGASSHIIATGGAGSSGLPALASGKRTSSTPSNTSTTNPPQ